MKLRSSSKPVQSVVAAIRALDLDPIKVKLMDLDEGQGWTREYADTMETAYKRFLTLLVKYPETTVAPSKEIDKFWHAHILDTLKYAEDCKQVFGYFLHHFPYFGLRGEGDAAQLAQAGKDMELLYQKEFGEAMPTGANSAYCFAAKPATNSAYCFAAKPATNSAYCFAAKPATNSAYCFAAKPATNSAYCFAAKPATNSAYCFAAKPAYCFAAKPMAQSAYCFAAKPNVTERPRLALAA